MVIRVLVESLRLGPNRIKFEDIRLFDTSWPDEPSVIVSVDFNRLG